MKNVTIMNTISTIISDSVLLSSFNFDTIRVYEDRLLLRGEIVKCWLEWGVFYEKGPGIVFQSEEFGKFTLEIPRLAAMLADLHGEWERENAPLPAEDFIAEPSPVGVKSGITEDTEDVINLSSIGVRPGWHTSVKDEEENEDDLSPVGTTHVSKKRDITPDSTSPDINDKIREAARFLGVSVEYVESRVIGGFNENNPDESALVFIGATANGTVYFDYYRMTFVQ